MTHDELVALVTRDVLALIELRLKAYIGDNGRVPTCAVLAGMAKAQHITAGRIHASLSEEMELYAH